MVAETELILRLWTAITLVVFTLLYFSRVRHAWKYRNPYERRCQTCGRLEVVECWPEDINKPLAGWWEVYNEGSGRCRKWRVRR